MPTIVGSSPPDSGTWKKDLGGILRVYFTTSASDLYRLSHRFQTGSPAPLSLLIPPPKRTQSLDQGAGGAEYKSTLDASSSTLNGAASINDPGNILKERRNGAREVQLVQDAINEELSARVISLVKHASLAGDYNPKSPTVSPQGRKDYILETVELLSEKNTNIAFDPIRTSLRHYMAGGPASEISNRLSDCLFNHAGKSGRSWGVCGVNYSTSNYFYDVPYEHERGDQCDRRPSVS
ncbi:uncharacterized protein ATNIH1004_009402 [Aspergillus tanneri]|uniref:Uncharacterized protein n=1 Tax=Aspergillus tanneri TaxID=1220188 RepID=A0A5M9MDZ4_9EURO|nr:uncharacterized protein ATNIH1004_009402 [Aspergillus tanneri]KAA8645185.1 hypothetical protein ATNIH1004_009402 [Aspergillus tanneri]